MAATATYQSQPSLPGAAAMPIQARLTVGAMNDPLEAEADLVADTVMRMPQQLSVQRKCSACGGEEEVQRKPAISFIQRKCDHCKDEDEESLQRKPLGSQIIPYLQAKADGSTPVSDAVLSGITQTKGHGSSLDGHTRSFMESRFGTDFSSVNIHTGDYAVQLSRELNAQAFTTGNDIYFNEGKYSPDSNSGRHLLAHELTHTIQQGGGGTGLVQREPIANVRVQGDARRVSPEGGVPITNGVLTWNLRFVGQVDRFSMGENDPGTLMEGTDVIMEASFQVTNRSANCPRITFMQVVEPTTGGIPDTARLIFLRDFSSGYSADVSLNETEPYYGLGYNQTSGALAPDMSSTIASAQNTRATFADGPKHPTSSIPPGQTTVRRFEVAVICVETGQTFGSIEWGYTKTHDGTVTLTGAQVANVHTGSATAAVEAARQAFYSGFFSHSLSGFARGSHALTTAHRDMLQQVAATALMEEIVLVGSNDFSGGAENNAALSLRRAQAARDFLVSLGVDAARIRTEGHGVTARVPNARGQSVPANRRVDVHIVRGRDSVAETVRGSAREALSLRHLRPVQLYDRLIQLLMEMQLLPGRIPLDMCNSLTNILDAIDRWRASDPTVPNPRFIYGERIRQLRPRCESLIPRERPHFDYSPPPLQPPSFLDRITDSVESPPF
jgi:outer membrane protein OmpA-like peptidoglycan-associated protein